VSSVDQLQDPEQNATSGVLPIWSTMLWGGRFVDCNLSKATRTRRSLCNIRQNCDRPIVNWSLAREAHLRVGRLPQNWGAEGPHAEFWASISRMCISGSPSLEEGLLIGTETYAAEYTEYSDMGGLAISQSCSVSC